MYLEAGQLFQRVVLMSGSALCPGALVRDPGRYTRQVAHLAGCPVDERVLECLREVPLETLLTSPIVAPAFRISFGPTIDSVIIGGQGLDDADGKITTLPFKEVNIINVYNTLTNYYFALI